MNNNQQEQILLKQSNGPSNYIFNTKNNHEKKVFPPVSTNIQKSGISTLQGAPLVDIDSELMNLNRIYSRDPNMKHKPDTKGKRYNHLQDGFFESQNTLLTNPPIELRGLAKNRFDFTHLDPLDNSIEPFERLGLNTHISLVDNYKDCK